MADIFLSYAREDWGSVESIVEKLQAESWTVFVDQSMTPVGRWREVIERELSIAGCVLVVWSKNSIRSRFVLDEADIGADREILIPIQVDGVTPRIGFRQFQTLDLSASLESAFYDSQLELLFAGVRETLRFSQTPLEERERALDALTRNVLLALSDTPRTTRQLSDQLSEPWTAVFRSCGRLEEAGVLISEEVSGPKLLYWPITGEIVTSSNSVRIQEQLATLQAILRRYSLKNPVLAPTLRAMVDEIMATGRLPAAKRQEVMSDLLGLLARTETKTAISDFVNLRSLRPHVRSWRLASQDSHGRIANSAT